MITLPMLEGGRLPDRRQAPVVGKVALVMGLKEDGGAAEQKKVGSGGGGGRKSAVKE